MNKRREKIPKYLFMGDFETTVYEKQERTDVWASALTRLFDDTDKVEVFNSLPATYEWITQHIKANCKIYYHNLKFDGTFWLSWLMDNGFTLAFEQTENEVIYENTKFEKQLKQGEFLKDKEMKPKSYKYLISDMGAWYTVTIKREDGYIIELRDSLKLIPVSVKKMGKDFKTKHQKTDIEYTGFRVPGGIITEQEKEYIANDVLVVKEVLEIMYHSGYRKLTIGSCCMGEYQSLIGGRWAFEDYFPRLDLWSIDPLVYGDDNADAYIRRAYHGGWCYVKEDRVGSQGKGCTADVNSLYPSVMSGESKNRYPYGKPFFFHDYVTWDKIKDDPQKYYFVRVRLRFNVKKDHLPFIQIKRNKLYKSTEMLKTSDVLYKGKYYKFLTDKNGNRVPTSVTVTFSKTDWELVQKHYDLREVEILDGCWFYTTCGVFDLYINRHKKIKMESKGAKRSIAKLSLNNLYGKFASGTNSSFKLYHKDEENALESETIFECKRGAVYIAVGAAITSYARAFTVTAAQLNYKHFCYADTDSIHCTCLPEELVGVPVHETDFLHWKIECEWDQAKFVRQKTYAEHVVKEDGEEVQEPYWNIKCAGLPQKCKELFVLSLKGVDNLSDDDIIEVRRKLKITDTEWEFCKVKRTIDDFQPGLKIPGKLLPVQIPGGTVLADVDFTMH